MKFNRNTYLRTLFLLGALAMSFGDVWAASSSCIYPASGSGIGGTGIVAKGTGMGGTGIKPRIEPGDELQLAGNVISSRGSAEAQSHGRSRLLAKGDAVCVGETIVTSQSGMLDIKMTDDGLVAVRPRTQLKIEQFAYNGTDKDSSLFSLLKGASRFVTGKLGKLHPQNDLVKTPNATIGVLGTDHEVTVILPSESGNYPSGTYDKVNQGITFIRTNKGQIDIYPNQVGLAVNEKEMPTLLKDVPNFNFINPAMKDEGGSSPGEDHKDESSGESKPLDSPEEHSGRTESAHPGETNTPSGEHPGIDMEHPESPSLFESPSVLESPEMPTYSD